MVTPPLLNSSALRIRRLFLRRKLCTLLELQQNACARFSDRPLFGTKQRDGSFAWMSYREFGEKIDQCRGVLHKAGVRRGDKVAIISKNRQEWAVSAFASYGLGAHHVPMYEQQATKEWEFIIRDSGARILLVANNAIHDSIEHLVGIDGPLSDILVFDHGETETRSFAKRLEAAGTIPALPDLSPEELCTLIYTSGTTGVPKGVMLSHSNVATNVKALRAISGKRLGPDTVSLSFLPWAHIYGQTVELHSLISAGASMGLAEAPTTLINDLQQVKPTLLVAVPAIYSKVYDGIHSKMALAGAPQRAAFKWAMAVARERREWFDQKGEGPNPVLWAKWRLAQSLVLNKLRAVFGGRLRSGMTGGAALPHQIQEFFDDIKIPILEGYGMTETAPIVVSERFGPTEKTQGGLRALPGVRVSICDEAADVEASGREGDGGEDGWRRTVLRAVPAGVQGEICVVGPNVMVGYHGRADATAEALGSLDGERAFRTGDLGTMSEDGVLSIKGRLKEQYKLDNGKFVIPGVVEEALTLRAEYVAQAFVHGLNRTNNVLLVVPDFGALRSELGLLGDPAELAASAQVLGAIGADLRLALRPEDPQGVAALKKAGLKSYAVPVRFAVLSEEFGVENGMLTPKLSIKRNVVAERYADVIDSLYAGGGLPL